MFDRALNTPLIYAQHMLLPFYFLCLIVSVSVFIYAELFHAKICLLNQSKQNPKLRQQKQNSNSSNKKNKINK